MNLENLKWNANIISVLLRNKVGEYLLNLLRKKVLMAKAVRLPLLFCMGNSLTTVLLTESEMHEWKYGFKLVLE